jgi:hypothetical protein
VARVAVSAMIVPVMSMIAIGGTVMVVIVVMVMISAHDRCYITGLSGERQRESGVTPDAIL